jgi:hypothetical protein
MGTFNFGIDDDLVEFGIGNIDAVESVRLPPPPDPTDIPEDYPIYFDPGIDSYAANRVKTYAEANIMPPIATFSFDATARKNNLQP